MDKFISDHSCPPQYLDLFSSEHEVREEKKGKIQIAKKLPIWPLPRPSSCFGLANLITWYASFTTTFSASAFFLSCWFIPTLSRGEQIVVARTLPLRYLYTTNHTIACERWYGKKDTREEEKACQNAYVAT